MYRKEVKIENETGLHARPASDFIALAKKFKSRVFIRNLDEADSSKVNAKSIVMLLSQGLDQGATAEVSAEGEDEEEVVEALVALIQTRFGE